MVEKSWSLIRMFYKWSLSSAAENQITAITEMIWNCAFYKAKGKYSKKQSPN